MKRNNSLLSVLLTFAMLVSLLPWSILPARADCGAASGASSAELIGSGTEDDPVLIRSAEALRELAVSATHYKGLYFKLTRSVDLSSVCGKGAGSWEPIGTSGLPFSGNFDGCGFTVSGLYAEGGDFLGLFGKVTGTVKNLNVEGTVSGSRFVGGVAAYNYYGRIENCSFHGTVDGEGAYHGGIAGAHWGGTISGCRVTGTVKNSGRFAGGSLVYDTRLDKDVPSAGGIAGSVSGNSIVAACVNSAAVEGHQFIGGVAGLTYGHVVNCCNEGAVSGEKATGGVAGQTHGELKDCRNVGAVTCSSFYAGGVAGDNYGTVTSCRNEGEIRGYGNGGVVGSNEGIVSGCRNSGMVFGSSNIGGIVGDNKAKGTVIECANMGDVSAEEVIGGVAGTNNGGVLTRCCSSGALAASKEDCGGIVGSMLNGTVEYCVNSGRVACDCSAGGLVGIVRGGTIQYCSNTGDVDLYTKSGSIPDDKKDTGGLVGYLWETMLRHCISTGSVNGSANVGAMVGTLNDAGLKKCVSRGTPKTKGVSAVGSVIGYWMSSSGECADACEIWRNYFFPGTGGVIMTKVGSTSGAFRHKYGTDLGDGYHFDDADIGKLVNDDRLDLCSDSDFFKTGTYTDWDFSDVWRMSDDGPRLRRLGVEKGGVLNVSGVCGLFLLSDRVNCVVDFYGDTVKLTADLDLGGESWTPIGYRGGYDDAAFSGTFDGGGYVVSSLRVDVSGSHAGLFGCLKGAAVKELRVVGSVSGVDSVGGIAGEVKDSRIENCSFKGSVSGKEEVGGIVGRMSDLSAVEGCAAMDAAVTGSGNRVGGIAGRVKTGTVKNCFHDGAVAGKDNVGGIAGYIGGGDGSAKITACCHYTGNVSGKGDVGGVVGYAVTGGKVSGCYYLSTAAGTGVGSSDGGSVSTVESRTLKMFRSSVNFSAFDFETGWDMTASRPLPLSQFATARFDANGGAGTMPDQRFVYGEAQELAANAFTHDGCVFAGWNTNANGTGTVYEDRMSVDHFSGAGGGTVTLYAQWIIVKPAVITLVSYSSSVLTCMVTDVGQDARLIAVVYDEHSGKMLDVRISDPIAANTASQQVSFENVTLLPSYTFKLMLVSETTWVPLCEALSG